MLLIALSALCATVAIQAIKLARLQAQLDRQKALAEMGEREARRIVDQFRAGLQTVALNK